MTNGTARFLLRPLIASLGLMMAVLASGCLWGVVKDAETGAGVSGATVTYTDAYGHTGSTTTGPSGLYAFDSATGPYPAAGPVTFQVSKAGYESVTVPRTVAYDDNANATLTNLSSFWDVQHFELSVVRGQINTAVSPLNYPIGVAYGKNGDIFFTDRVGCTVGQLHVDSGVVTTVAGTGICGYSGDGGSAGLAQLSSPTGLAIAENGDLAVVDTDNCRIRQIDMHSSTITTIAGNGTCGFAGDGGLATAASIASMDPAVVGIPLVWSDIAYGPTGDLYIADQFNCRVRKVDAAMHTISTVAGSGGTGFGCAGYAGDGGPATAAVLSRLTSVGVNDDSDIFIGDMDNCVIRKVDGGSGRITTVAGNGVCGSSGDGGRAVDAGLANVRGLTVDTHGVVFFSEFRYSGMMRADCFIRRIGTDGRIDRIAGTGSCNLSGDGGDATSAEIESPADLALSCGGDLAFASPVNGAIREVTAISRGGPEPDADGDGDADLCD